MQNSKLHPKGTALCRTKVDRYSIAAKVNFYLLIFLSLCTLNFKFLTISPVFAQSRSTKNTLSVTPQLTQLDLAIDEPESLLYYKNTSPYPLELSLSVENVRELEDRNPIGILDQKESANYKYSLSSWVTLDRQTLLLSPGEERTVKVSIAKEKLSPGGHYGTILAAISQDTGKDKVKIRGVLASLLFVRAATGNEIEDAKISFFGPIQNGISFPAQFSMRFQNTGNIDAIPYGVIEVKDSNGKMVARGIVNEDSAITLPEAIRTYIINIKTLQSILFPGKYTATLSLHYGKSNKTITTKSEFTTLGSTTVLQWGGAFLILAALILIGFKILRSKKNTI